MHANRLARASRMLLVLLSLAALGLAGCQSNTGGATGARLAKILKSGELRVGLTADQPPLNMRNKAGDMIGLEIDLMRALADAMGLEAKFVPMPFTELIGALEDGKVDVVASGMTITPERNARVAFAGPYFITGKSVLSKSDKISNVESVSELDVSGRSYAALAGSTSEKFIRESLPNAKLVTTSNYEEGVRMVTQGKVDALVGDYQSIILWVWRLPEEDLHALLTPFTVEPLGIALPADAPLLVNLVDNYLEALDYTGLLTQFKARWLSNGDWIDQLP